MNKIFPKIKKIKYFLGPAKFRGPPVFVNSMPKAGTNLFESLLVELGYKRNLARCLNEQNLIKTNIKPKAGHFYVAHLTCDELVHTFDHQTFFLTRRLWDCLTSYVNYMVIDPYHPVSNFVRTGPIESALNKLFFTANNPNKCPLVDEYSRFYDLNDSKYDLVIPFEDLIVCENKLMKEIAKQLGTSQKNIEDCLFAALKGESYTKNVGRINLFSDLSPDTLTELREEVESKDQIFT